MTNKHYPPEIQLFTPIHPTSPPFVPVNRNPTGGMAYLYNVIKKTPDIMPIKYRLVLRKDMTKGAAAGSKLYYAVNKSTGTCDFEELCDQIADRSTASRGDVQVVVDGLLYILKQRLQKGETVQLGDLGHFQAVIGSKGTKLESDFNASLIKRPRIVFRPSVTLKSVTGLAKFEKIVPDAPAPGGGDSESPDEI